MKITQADVDALPYRQFEDACADLTNATMQLWIKAGGGTDPTQMRVCNRLVMLTIALDNATKDIYKTFYASRMAAGEPEVIEQ